MWVLVSALFLLFSVKNAIFHNVHELKSSAADDNNIILPSQKVKAWGSHQFRIQRNFNALQSSVGNN